MAWSAPWRHLFRCSDAFLICELDLNRIRLPALFLIIHSVVHSFPRLFIRSLLSPYDIQKPAERRSPARPKPPEIETRLRLSSSSARSFVPLQQELLSGQVPDVRRNEQLHARRLPPHHVHSGSLPSSGQRQCPRRCRDGRCHGDGSLSDFALLSFVAFDKCNCRRRAPEEFTDTSVCLDVVNLCNFFTSTFKAIN